MEKLIAPSSPGSVVLDIGENVGAAVIHTPASLAGAELEIRAADAPWDGRHVAVRARQLPHGGIFAAVFAGLDAGPYEVRVRHHDSGIPGCAFEVRGGAVTELRLSAGAGAG